MPHPRTRSARDGFAAWRADLRRNAVDADPHLASLTRFHRREHLLPELRAFGQISTRELDTWARTTNRDEHLPVLHRYDGQGNRVEGITFHPDYHQMGRAIYATGVIAKYARPGQEFGTVSLLYLASQNGESGHCCPIACTAGLVKILQQDTAPHSEWLARLLDPNYDTHFHGAQFLTEVQGGSDVGANAVVAREFEGEWHLHGEKWFCSVIDADLFLVTARPEGEGAGTQGLRAFAVPRVIDGQVNDFRIRRLKYKLGTRSMASAEVDFEGAVGIPVGTFKTTVEVVLNTSRLFNAICSSGAIHRAAREAEAYARTRIAFGQPILAFPTVARIVARLKCEAYAARSVTFLLAHLSDELALGRASADAAAAYRMLVNLNKFWTAHAATNAAREAIEVLGGNGAIEEFSVLPRLLRDMIVCEAWEGGHNVLCAQVLKDSVRLGTHEGTFRYLATLGGETEELARARSCWQQLLDMDPALQPVHMRDIAEALRVWVQAHVLRAESAHPGSDPSLPTIIAHLLAPDPLQDPDLMHRVQALVR